MALIKYEFSLLKELVALDTSVDRKVDYKDMTKILRRECESIGAKTRMLHQLMKGRTQMKML